MIDIQKLVESTMEEFSGKDLLGISEDDLTGVLVGEASDEGKEYEEDVNGKVNEYFRKDPKRKTLRIVSKLETGSTKKSDIKVIRRGETVSYIECKHKFHDQLKTPRFQIKKVGDKYEVQPTAQSDNKCAPTLCKIFNEQSDTLGKFANVVSAFLKELYGKKPSTRHSGNFDVDFSGTTSEAMSATDMGFVTYKELRAFRAWLNTNPGSVREARTMWMARADLLSNPKHKKYEIEDEIERFAKAKGRKATEAEQRKILEKYNILLEKIENVIEEYKKRKFWYTVIEKPKNRGIKHYGPRGSGGSEVKENMMTGNIIDIFTDGYTVGELVGEDWEDKNVNYLQIQNCLFRVGDKNPLCLYAAGSTPQKHIELYDINNFKTKMQLSLRIEFHKDKDYEDDYGDPKPNLPDGKQLRSWYQFAANIRMEQADGNRELPRLSKGTSFIDPPKIKTPSPAPKEPFMDVAEFVKKNGK